MQQTHTCHPLASSNFFRQRVPPASKGRQTCLALGESKTNFSRLRWLTLLTKWGMSVGGKVERPVDLQSELLVHDGDVDGEELVLSEEFILVWNAHGLQGA